MEQSKNKNENDVDKHEMRMEKENNESYLNSIWDKVMIFYNKNKNELLVVLCLLVAYNFICPSSLYQYSNKQSGGDMKDFAKMEQLAKMDPEKKKLLKGAKGFNVLQKMLGWLLSFVQSLITFAGLVLVLAVLPGLPIFIFMLILFFILRARVAALKAY